MRVTLRVRGAGGASRLGVAAGGGCYLYGHPQALLRQSRLAQAEGVETPFSQVRMGRGRRLLLRYQIQA